MVLHYTGGPAFKSGKYLFTDEGEYKVDDKFGAYLLKTYPEDFKSVTDSVMEPPKEDREAKPKTIRKVTNTATKK